MIFVFGYSGKNLEVQRRVLINQETVFEEVDDDDEIGAEELSHKQYFKFQGGGRYYGIAIVNSQG
jgi:hypothetical protein